MAEQRIRGGARRKSGVMDRGAGLPSLAIVVLTTVLCSGCSTNSSMIMPAGPPQIGAARGDEKAGRAARVAFTSACAQAYGVAHDPTKLRAAYVRYETTQGAKAGTLAALENDYDTTYRSIMDLGAQRANYCSAKDGQEINADLRRYQAGHFEARAPAPQETFSKTVWETCGERC